MKGVGPLGVSLFSVLVLLVMLSACAPAAYPDTAAPADAAPTTAAAPADATASPAPTKAVTMNPIGTLATGENSAVSGSAEVAALPEGKFQVTVTLSGLPANSTHMGHIHVGDCTVVGPVALGLTEITSDAGGNGAVTSEVKGVLPADGYIAYHQRGPTDPEGIGSFITCGNIPK